MDIVQNNGRRLPVAAGTGSVVWVKDANDDDWKIYLQHMAVNQPSPN